MKNQKYRYTIFILLILLLIGIINTPNSVIKSTSLSENNREIDTDQIKQAIYWELNYIHINNNWSETASMYDWCTGFGTLEKPYIIENITITLVSSESGIVIQNTFQHFVISNCTIHNRATGVYLNNVTNGVLLNNNCSYNSYGIQLNDCLNNSISSNYASFNIDTGIHLYNSNSCYISGNTVNENTGGARRIGVFLEESNNNTIYDNNLYLNGDYGIEMLNSDRNLMLNNIFDSNWKGIRVSNSDNNLFVKNYFLNSVIVHAEDNSIQNHWNNTNIGNYWDDYAGVDADVNGIGDSSYSISGTTKDDYLPIYGNPFHNGSNIFINGTKSSGFESWQWLSTRAYCSGSGTEVDPYVFEHLDINGQEMENCFEIINSNKYFEIKYCNLYNSSSGFFGLNGAGFRLVNCSNGLLNNNNISSHSNGILLDNCNNLILSNNEISESNYGIYAINGSYNRISFNLITDCGSSGAYISGSGSYKFIIDNNKFINNFPGVYLYGKAHELFNNTFTNIGICIAGSREELISYNIDTTNTLNNKPIYYYANKTNLSSQNFINAGQILLANCDNSKVADLNFSNIELPIFMVYCSGNEISNISITNEIYGMGFVYCEDNTYKNNAIKDCGIGIWMLGNCNNNEFIKNRIINTTAYGIRLGGDNNLFFNNLFKDNQQYGLSLDEFSDGNLMYKNIFLNNSEHAYDESVSNYWDNGTLGNYWDDYNGLDLNGDGIGESPYIVPGTTGNQDNFPLIYPPSPEITILVPIENASFGAIPPEFEISIQGFNVVKIWYTIDNGAHNYTITELVGTINSTAWYGASIGPVIMRFYANNSWGNIGQAEIMIQRDIIMPLITINSPSENQVFGKDAPSFDLTILGHEINSTWYTLDYGNINISFSGSAGTIDQTEWGKKGGGTAPIRFYVNDSLGNVDYVEVIVIKDIISPIVSINLPSLNELFGSTPPNFDITVTESNLDSMWYTLDSGATNITFGSLTGTIDQTEWDKKGNGTVTIKFYAKDEGGNEGFAEIIVRKDDNIPLITIIAPNKNEIFGLQPPQYDISVVEPNIDLMWYTLDNGITNTSFTEFTGTIDQSEWDKFGDGIVIIQFYVRDKSDNDAFAEVSVNKDLIAPIITINQPEFGEVFVDIAPLYSITIVETSLDSYWYSLDDGQTNHSISELTGAIDQNAWDSLLDGHITLKFFAKDEAGNVGQSSIILTKRTTPEPTPPGIPGYNKKKIISNYFFFL